MTTMIWMMTMIYDCEYDDDGDADDDDDDDDDDDVR